MSVLNIIFNSFHVLNIIFKSVHVQNIHYSIFSMSPNILFNSFSLLSPDICRPASTSFILWHSETGLSSYTDIRSQCVSYPTSEGKQTGPEPLSEDSNTSMKKWKSSGCGEIPTLIQAGGEAGIFINRVLCVKI